MNVSFESLQSFRLVSIGNQRRSGFFGSVGPTQSAPVTWCTSQEYCDGEVRQVGRDETIYVIENNPSLSEHLETFLRNANFSVQVFSTGEEFLAIPTLADVGCVITELQLPAMQAIEIHKELCWRESNLSFIGIAEFRHPKLTIPMMNHGAVAILKSPPDLDELLAAVKNGIAKSLIRQATRDRSNNLRDRLRLLTDSERMVMKCLIKGLSHKAVSSLLDLSPRSVDRRRKSILEKTGAPTFQELVANLAELQLPDWQAPDRDDLAD